MELTIATYSGPDARQRQYAAACAEMARYHAQSSKLLRQISNAQSLRAAVATDLRHLAMCLNSLANEIEFAAQNQLGAA